MSLSGAQRYARRARDVYPKRLCPKRPRLLLLLLPSPTIPAINDYGVSTLIEWATLLSGFAAACSRPLPPVRWHMRGVLLN
jgi:hypothetical protein